MIRLEPIQPKASGPAWRALVVRSMCALIVAGTLASCADTTDSDDDRQFANDPVATDRPGATEPPTEAVESTDVETSPTETVQGPLLHARGAPQTVYAIVGGVVQVIDAATNTITGHIAPEAGTVFDAATASPSGDRVAVLARTGAQIDVMMFDRDGRFVASWDHIAAAEVATPVADEDDVNATSSIAWSASGRDVLVAIGGPSIITIDVNGKAREIRIPKRVGRLVAAMWSPRGDTIAMLGHDPEGRGVLWTFAPNVDGESLRRLEPPDVDSSDLGSVHSFAWLPDGSGIVYLMAGSDHLDDPGGQLYLIDLASGVRRVIASPGRVGPAARIVSVAVSPDGKSVAYAVASPEGRRWQFDSLWVKRIAGSAIEEVPVDSADELGEIRWVRGGLIVERINGDTAEWLFLASDAQPRLVQQASPAGATPVSGTPVSASPVTSTPVIATPVFGTPVSATPEGAPPGSATPIASPSPATPVAATPRG